jgi:hypothetical protein
MCRTKTLIFGVLLFGVGAAVGILVDRYTLQAPAAEPKPIRPDQNKLIASWAYPNSRQGAKTYSGGQAGLIFYYVITSTPDDLAKVAAFYQPLVGIPIEVDGSSGSGGGGDDYAMVSAIESWGKQRRRIVLAGRTEAGYSATVVLFRGDDDDETRIVVSLTGH